MLKKMNLILPIFVCIFSLYLTIKQLYLINFLKKNGLHSEAKVYSWCTPNCILVDLKDSKVIHSGLRISVIPTTIYNYGDWVNIIYDKNNKKKIIVDDAIQTIYFPYSSLLFFLIALIFFIRRSQKKIDLI